MLLADMLLQLIKAGVPHPFVASTALGAADNVAEMVLDVDMLRLNMAVAIGFAAEGGVAALPSAGVADRVGGVGGVDEAVSKVVGCDDTLFVVDHELTEIERGSQ